MAEELGAGQGRNNVKIVKFESVAIPSGDGR